MAYTAHFVRPNFGYAEDSYIVESLSEIRAEEGDKNTLNTHADAASSKRFTRNSLLNDASSQPALGPESLPSRAR